MRFNKGLKYIVFNILLTASHFLSAVEGVQAEGVNSQSRLAAVLVTGSTRFSHDQQLEIYQYFLGQPITAGLVENLKEDFQSAYTDGGVLKPRVSISSHSDYSDILIVKLQEPQIGQFDLQPRGGPLAEKIRTIVLNKNFSNPLRNDEVRELLEELSNIEGAVVEASFEPRAGDSSYYDLRIEAKPRLQAWLEFSNEGGELLGPEIAETELKYNRIFNAPLNIGVFAAKTTSTSLYEQFGAYLEWQPSSKWLTLLSYSDSDSLDQVALTSADDIQYNTDNWRLDFRYAAINSLDREWDIYTRLSHRDHTRLRGGAAEFEQLLNTITVGNSYNYFGQSLSFWADAKAVKSINDFGAKNNDLPSGIPAAGDLTDLSFLYWEAQFVSWMPVYKKITARLDIRGQYTNDVLPTSQTFVLGGTSYTRAYEPGEIIGDRGVAGNLELRYRAQLNSKLSLTPYTYYGIGQVSSTTEASNRDISAASAGAGLRLRNYHVKVYVEVDKPLTRRSIHKGDDFRANAGIEFHL